MQYYGKYSKISNSFFFLFSNKMLAIMEGTKIFQYCICHAGRVTYTFHSSCKCMYLSFKSVCNEEHKEVICNMTYFCLFDLILYVPSTIFQLYRDGSSWVEPVQARNNVLAQGHNTVRPVMLEPAAPSSRVKHSTTEPLRSPIKVYAI